MHVYLTIFDAFVFVFSQSCKYRYVDMSNVIPMGSFAAVRTVRVLRALKTVAIVPGKPIVTS